jgi:hypothetical protein
VQGIGGIRQDMTGCCVLRRAAEAGCGRLKPTVTAAVTAGARCHWLVPYVS